MRNCLTLWILFLAVCTSDQPAHAQDKPAGDTERLTYVLKYIHAKDMVSVLAKHFKGAAEIQAVPESPVNVLLISGSPAALKEIAALLPKLDRKPREIAIDVWVGMVVAEPGAPKQKEGEAALDVRDFAGPRAKIMAKLDNLQTNLRLKEWKHFQGTATENQVYKVISTENRSIVSNVMTTATGLTTKSLIRQNVGVAGQLTVFAAPDNDLLIDFDLEHTRVLDGKIMAQDAQGLPIHEAIISRVAFKSKVSLRSGQALAPEALKESRNNGDTQSLLILTATVVEPGTEPPGR
jgi:hypothetical protein